MRSPHASTMVRRSSSSSASPRGRKNRNRCPQSRSRNARTTFSRPRPSSWLSARDRVLQVEHHQVRPTSRAGGLDVPPNRGRRSQVRHLGKKPSRKPHVQPPRLPAHESQSSSPCSSASEAPASMQSAYRQGPKGRRRPPAVSLSNPTRRATRLKEGPGNQRALSNPDPSRPKTQGGDGARAHSLSDPNLRTKRSPGGGPGRPSTDARESPPCLSSRSVRRCAA